MAMKKINLVLIVSLMGISLSSLADWKNTSEVNILKSGGNTDVSVYNVKSETSVDLSKHAISLDGHYTLGEADSTVDARNWSARLKDQYTYAEHWAVFVAQKIAGDRFKGYEKRYFTDIGSVYKLFNLDDKKSNFEAGYRYVVEEKTDHSYTHNNQLRLFGDYDQKLNKNVSFKFFSEYLKDIEIGDAWEFNFGPSVTSTLSSIFSLKVGFKGEYRNLPAVTGARKFDYTYTTGLIASF
ncbi:MAG: hypothetical protein COW01_03260 [Bdellovibrionales bacterium CG12_big_fil_rev_8_21_14_0_65_38_15]|nr:MAG: hypothetical protein COW79_12500 [Bdellovibrionales bacterium CG22_combo_CG10-13_8_21_14_all_38_13]PIQ56863.1 MAG: hypothetical protein COW01_03260 [Bdellovibrionales bacterium CG12_big_fil_rev_8_21_14_0_65_38_15]PIR30028.1 MAG: hypothetical protein COV38_06980 [Bdellovibrionales bacterium CG11_big_fil_rev_8_21_14_0_20_38_13]